MRRHAKRFWHDGAVILWCCCVVLPIVLSSGSSSFRDITDIDIADTVGVRSRDPSTYIAVGRSSGGALEEADSCNRFFYSNDCLTSAECTFCCSAPIGRQCVTKNSTGCPSHHILNNASLQCGDLCHPLAESSSSSSSSGSASSSSRGSGKGPSFNCSECVSRIWCYFCYSTSACGSPRDHCPGGQVLQTCNEVPISSSGSDANSELWYHVVVYASTGAAGLLLIVAICVMARRCHRPRLGAAAAAAAAHTEHLLRPETPLLTPHNRDRAANPQQVGEGDTGAVYPTGTTLNSATVTTVVVATDDPNTTTERSRLMDSSTELVSAATSVMLRESERLGGDSEHDQTAHDDAVDEDEEEEERDQDHGDDTVPTAASGTSAEEGDHHSTASSSTDRLCQLCFEEEAQIAFLPCYHFHCCTQCCGKLRPNNRSRMELTCPFCRHKINAMIRLSSLLQKKLE